MPIQDQNAMTLGSDAWVDDVYKSGPSRNSEGRSRPTQRYFGAGLEAINAGVFEGRNEYITYLLLCVLQHNRIISRFKGQPFRMNKANHGVDAYPDFMFDLADGRRFVLEVKANRFINDDEKKQLEAVNDAFINTSITYLLWTDKWPLHKHVVHAMNHMRRAYRLGYSTDQLQPLVNAIQVRPKTLGELCRGVMPAHFDQILAAAYCGMIFINFFKPINDQTLVSCEPDKSIVELLFQTRIKGSTGWDAGIRC